jgi:threonine dehydratase
MIPSSWLDLAAHRLAGQVERTPLTYDPALDLYLKWENRQKTGSFKIRGALNKVYTLQDWERQRGLVTASAGNHGQGLALAAREVGVPVIIFASDHAVPAKIDAMRALGADVRLVPGGYELAEEAAQRFASESGATWVSPYNDMQVIAGQGTVGLEILDQIAPKTPGAVIVPVGGGGLISGIGAAMQAIRPRPRIIGAQSTASPFFHQLFHQDTQDGAVELPSLADGLAGRVEAGSVTIPLVRELVDDMILVTEEQIASAIAYAWRRHGEKIEGSGAVPLAAVLSGAMTGLGPSHGPVVAVISGGNIQPDLHERLCAQIEP